MFPLILTVLDKGSNREYYNPAKDCSYKGKHPKFTGLRG